jgi:hypothetical protein
MANTNMKQSKSKTELKNNMINNEIREKVETPIKCQEKGLHYIGEMNFPKVFHKTIKLQDGRILIIGGSNEIKIENTQPNLKGPFYNTYNYKHIKNTAAEIFNPLDHSFSILQSSPLQSNYSNIITLDNGNILLISKELEIYDIKEKQFKLITNRKQNNKIKNLYPEFSAMLNSKYIIECNYSNEIDFINNTCMITDLTNYDVLSYKNINLDFPTKPTLLGYLKINENELLIYTKKFSNRNKISKLYAIIYDIKNNKILKTKELIEYFCCNDIFKAILIDKNRVIFAQTKDYEGARNIHCPSTQWFIYNIEKNIVEKNLNMIYPKSVFEGNPIVCNNHILIFEGNKIRQIFDLKTNELKKYDGFTIDYIRNMNIIQITNNQFLITGGIRKNNNLVNTKAWIYTF